MDLKKQISLTSYRFKKLVKISQRYAFNIVHSSRHSHKDIKNIPVIINNFNRLNYLKQQISWLEKVGIQRIYILDNDSTYEPLLDFYKKTPHEVILLGKNVGHLALWETDVFNKFEHNYYIYTDPDVIPVEECPDDFLAYFMEILNRYLEFDKVGFSLKVDDIPDYYPHKTKVLDIEENYWNVERKITHQGQNLYMAPIDTTFAVYRPFVKGGFRLKAIRTGFPYMLRHLPWYIDFEELSEEDKFYLDKTSKSSYWFSQKTN